MMNSTLPKLSINYITCGVAHLSNQFKKMTGLTPPHLKSIKNKIQVDLGNV